MVAMGWCGGEIGSRRKERKRGTLREVLCCDGLGRLGIGTKSFTLVQFYFTLVEFVDVLGNHGHENITTCDFWALGLHLRWTVGLLLTTSVSF